MASGINWRKAGAYVLVALPVVGLAGIAVLAHQQQQNASPQPAVDPLADAARKAREQKKDAPKSKKVYTNDDVASAPAATPAAAEQKADGKENPEAKERETTAGAEPAEKGAPAKNSEADWRKRFAEARQNLADAQRELDILQRESQKAQVQYYSDPQKALAEQYTRKDVNDLDTKIDAKKQEVEKLKQHLSDMEDELRRTGGDIGWSRE